MKWLQQRRKVTRLETELASKIRLHAVNSARVEDNVSSLLRTPGAKVWAFSAGLLVGLRQKNRPDSAGNSMSFFRLLRTSALVLRLL